jgi:branched-chain amino acid aminotransferase
MTFFVYEKGKKVAPEQLPPGLGADAIGLFESLRTYGACIFREDEHLDRLYESAKTSGFEVPLSRKQLSRELALTVKALRQDLGPDEDLFLRLTLFPGRVFVIGGQKKHAPALYKTGVGLRTTVVRRSLTNSGAPQTKTSDYRNAVMAALEPSPGVYEHLFLDADGFVAEVSVGNLFIVKKGAVKTPPAQGILNGVTRRFVIECVLPRDMEFLETPMTRHDVYNADEVFLTNTSWEILPVREVDGRRIRQVPGPITQKIHRLFKKKAGLECRTSR